MALQNSARSFILPALILALTALGCSSTADPHIGGTVQRRWLVERRRAGRVPGDGPPVRAGDGVSVQYTGTRDLNGLLWQGVAQKDPPDVAGLPGPGQMAEFARFRRTQGSDQRYRRRRLQEQTVPTFIDLGTVDGKLVGVFIKATLKGLIWYNPKVYTRRRPAHLAGPQITAGAIAAARGQNIWCMGLGSGGHPAGRARTGSRTSSCARAGPTSTTTGSPASCPGRRPRSSAAFQRFGEVVARLCWRPDAQSSPRTSRDGGNGLFSDPPQCLFPPGDVHDRVLQDRRPAPATANTTSSRSRPSTRASPTTSPAPATCSACSATRRRLGR